MESKFDDVDHATRCDDRRRPQKDGSHCNGFMGH